MKIIRTLIWLILALAIFIPSQSIFAAETMSALDKSKLVNSPTHAVIKTGIKKTPIDKIALKLAHLKKYRFVKRGEVIGSEGGMPDTCGCGQSIGPHVHFEVRVNKEDINPRDKIGKAMSWPLVNFRVTQEFGPADWTSWYTFHTGIDIASRAGWGAPVRAAAAGRIIFDSVVGGYGHLIIINHGKGIFSYYGHLRC